VSVVKVLPELRASGAAQMALDAGLLETGEQLLARRYVWAPPTLSLGKFQHVELVPDLPFDVVRRASGGRAVLHGEGFEWSFAVLFPRGALGGGPRATVDLRTPYDLVAGAFAGALEDLDVTLDDGRTIAYQRSALCFSTALRHDVLARGEKLVAVAQARRDGRVLVHGSVLERRPPHDLVAGVELLLGEVWRGEGLAAVAVDVDVDRLWRRALLRLEAGVRRFWGVDEGSGRAAGRGA
jgi:lipoate-protein ligase A